MFVTMYREEISLRKQRVASLSRDEEAARGRGETEGDGGCVTHSLTLMEGAERTGDEGEKKTDADRAQLRRQKRRRSTRGEPVSPSPRLIYLNLRNSVSCRGLYIGQAQVAGAKSLRGERRDAHSEGLSLVSPSAVNQTELEKPY